MVHGRYPRPRLTSPGAKRGCAGLSFHLGLGASTCAGHILTPIASFPNLFWVCPQKRVSTAPGPDKTPDIVPLHHLGEGSAASGPGEPSFRAGPGACWEGGFILPSFPAPSRGAESSSPSQSEAFLPIGAWRGHHPVAEQRQTSGPRCHAPDPHMQAPRRSSLQHPSLYLVALSKHSTINILHHKKSCTKKVKNRKELVCCIFLVGWLVKSLHFRNVLSFTQLSLRAASQHRDLLHDLCTDGIVKLPFCWQGPRAG